jgi:DNA-binding MarR family transcriptional regulator
MSTNDASALATANALRRHLADFARLMRSLRADHGVSASKLSALGRLHREERPLSAATLASLEGLQPQSLTRIIADLEAQHLITRRPNSDDRRQIDIMLSEDGRALLERDAQRQNAWLCHEIVTRLTPAERAILALAAELLGRLAGSGDHSTEAGG